MRIPTWRLALSGGAMILLVAAGIGLVAATSVPTGSAQNIAAAVSFLASSDSAYITGQVIYVDGGFLADYGIGVGKTST